MSKIPDNCLLKFSAEWCAPCKAMAPLVKQVADEKEVELIEIDIEEDSDLANQFGVRNIPTIFAIKDGEPVEMTVGVKTKDELEELAGKVKSIPPH